MLQRRRAESCPGGISSFFYHFRFLPRFFNNIFQGKLRGVRMEISRFLVNSTLGFAGALIRDLQPGDVDLADRVLEHAPASPNDTI